MISRAAPTIAIACGGTGGHLFPGLAVAEQLVRRGCAVTLLVSPKDVDQQAVKTASGMEIVTLPAVGLGRGKGMAFARGFVKSYRTAKKHFKLKPPQAVLAMGGFTSAPPILAGRRLGARTFLHESNTIPGRANRWLSRFVDCVFVGFPQAAPRLRNRGVSVTGTPVRPQFQPADASACRTALGLDPNRPVLLVMGGSQGAKGINDLSAKAFPLLAKACPELQCFILTGPADADKLRNAAEAHGVKAVVHPFFANMELALGAATVAVSRAGASSLAELAAVRLPAVLIPYPVAADNHQFHNARAFDETGAARLLKQEGATPEALVNLVAGLLSDQAAREKMQASLARWHAPNAAEDIAGRILRAVGATDMAGAKPTSPTTGEPSDPRHRMALDAAAVGTCNL